MTHILSGTSKTNMSSTSSSRGTPSFSAAEKATSKFVAGSAALSSSYLIKSGRTAWTSALQSK